MCFASISPYDVHGNWGREQTAEHINKRMQSISKTKFEWSPERREEIRGKNSVSHKGKSAWNNGRTSIYSNETLIKIGNASRGRIVSEDTRKKLGNIHRGKPSGMLGKVAWNRGIPALWFMGDKNPNWKGGLSKEVEIIRHSLEYRIWQRDVLNRDHYKCFKCSTRTSTVHHIKGFMAKPDLRFNLNNGIAMCKSCHKNFHIDYGWRNNSVEQLKLLE